MAASGNVRRTQIRAGDIKGGAATQLQAFGGGSTTTGNVAMYDSSGNIIDGLKAASSIGGGSGYYPTLTAPVSGDFAWINQGGASVAAASGGFHLNAPADAGINLRIRKRAAPSTPYKIEVAFLAKLYPAESSHVCGVCFRQSSDGKLVSFHVTQGLLHQVNYYDSPTALNTGNVFSVTSNMAFNSLMWYRFGDDGTGGGSARTFEFSWDGQNWLQMAAQGRTVFITPDEVGVFADSENTGHAAGMTLVHWLAT